ncbi:MAG: DUF4160 domain-containing protein [Oscillospiraceae bacterium]|jgi:hypothetical protein|nr:DUF4160 domain-containing protein [Oscillospiraceae bacterium]MDR1330209.1 DUF4160 domain-containing protein [Oscillospiraceae bacterium]
MPIISSFYGIIIRMYFNDTEQHHTPHFHAKYAEYEASFNLDGNILAGEFPPKKANYVTVWADIHREELAALWEIMQTDEEYFKIKGLE